MSTKTGSVERANIRTKSDTIDHKASPIKVNSNTQFIFSSGDNSNNNLY